MHITTANTDDTDNSVQTTGMTGVRKNSLQLSCWTSRLQAISAY